MTDRIPEEELKKLERWANELLIGMFAGPFTKLIADYREQQKEVKRLRHQLPVKCAECGTEGDGETLTAVCDDCYMIDK